MKRSDSFYTTFASAREQHQRANHGSRKDFKGITDLNFNSKPFFGHASRLGHYFRHLYMTVRFVAQREIITNYKDRKRFLKILRGQLSNHEQIMLFYNWLGDFASKWGNGKQQFFTEYWMIHNLWYDALFDEKLIKEAVQMLRDKPGEHRKDKKVFELDEP